MTNHFEKSNQKNLSEALHARYEESHARLFNYHAPLQSIWQNSEASLE